MDFDSIMDLYNYTKRDKGNSIYYDADKDEVYSSKSGLEGIVLINDTNCLCNTVIKQYLEEPFICSYKEECQNCLKTAKKKVVSFLSFFDHIDGAYDFELYEALYVRKVLMRFCKANQIPYNDMNIYSEKNMTHTFLTEKRGEASKQGAFKNYRK